MNGIRHIVLTLLALTALTGCREYEDDPAVGKATGPSLAFCVSTLRATRMSDAVTQQEGQLFRGIQDLWLFPFKSSSMAESLDGNATTEDMAIVNSTHYYYLDDKRAEIPNETNHFLCYARAVPDNGGLFVNGSIRPSITSEFLASKAKLTTADVTFAPEQIYTATTSANSTIPATDAKATAIADYLTAIANAIPTDYAAFFHEFVNKGHPVASSSKNAAKLAAWVGAWASENNVTISMPTAPDAVTDDPTVPDDGYPENILLPEGAAVVRWMKPANESDYRFVPQVQTTPEDNINSLDRFIYPAELYYYANSPIKTSKKSLKEHYEDTAVGNTWDKVLAEYDDGYGVMSSSVHSVAIVDPLHYAVGCLQIGLVVSSTLTDASDTPITVSASVPASGETAAIDASFPLSAVFVSGQYQQNYEFTPMDNVDEKIIYDKEISGFSMGDAKRMSASSSTTPAPTAYTNTLVLQTKDDAEVRFALEFTNNSGTDFQGYNGKVFQGAKFYLVGTIRPNYIASEGEHTKRVFTKDFITRGTVIIRSLQQAYTYLPDLLDPRLEIGIRLVPDWIQVTTTNVPL